MNDALNTVLLQLHAACRHQPLQSFKPWALNLVQSVVSFRHAHWGSAVLADRTIISLHAHVMGLDPGYEDRFNAMSHLDPKSQDVVAKPGVTFLRDGHDPLETPVAFRQGVLDPAGVRYGAVTAMVDPRSGLVEGLAFMRGTEEGAFTEDERQCVQALVPHLCQARSAHLVERAHDALDAGLQASYHTVVSSTEGYLMAIEPEAMQLMLREWPDWPGGRLPDPLSRLAGSSGGEAGPDALWRGRAIVVRLHCTSTQLLLRLRLPNRVDSLGARELSVAEQFAAGESYKDIARTFNLSPSTVSNQLAKVYEKLGVRNKSELLRCLNEWR